MAKRQSLGRGLTWYLAFNLVGGVVLLFYRQTGALGVIVRWQRPAS